MGPDHLTFGLAFAGYLLLSGDLLLRLAAKEHRLLTGVLAAVVTAHVLCVWALRYGWRFDKAFDGRAAGFLLFHGALALIVASPFTTARTTLRLLGVSFAVVSMGAIGAVFKYEVVAVLQIPLLAACTSTVVAAAWLARRRRRAVVTD